MLPWLFLTLSIIRAVSRVAVLPVRHRIALNLPSNVSVGILIKMFFLQSYLYETLKSTSKYTKGHLTTQYVKSILSSNLTFSSETALFTFCMRHHILVVAKTA